jgi:hypothetical protein
MRYCFFFWLSIIVTYHDLQRTPCMLPLSLLFILELKVTPKWHPTEPEWTYFMWVHCILSTVIAA